MRRELLYYQNDQFAWLVFLSTIHHYPLFNCSRGSMRASNKVCCLRMTYCSTFSMLCHCSALLYASSRTHPIFSRINDSLQLEYRGLGNRTNTNRCSHISSYWNIDVFPCFHNSNLQRQRKQAQRP